MIDSALSSVSSSNTSQGTFPHQKLHPESKVKQGFEEGKTPKFTPYYSLPTQHPEQASLQSAAPFLPP